MEALAGSVLGGGDIGAQLEIVEAEESAGPRGGRGGNGGFVHVGEVGFAIHAVAMKAGVEGAGRLIRGAAETDPMADAGTVVHHETLRFQPGGSLGDVIRGEAEAVAELFGRQPLPVIGGSGKLLFGKKGVNGMTRSEEHTSELQSL